MLCRWRSRSQQHIPAAKQPAPVLWAGVSFSPQSFPCVNWVIHLRAALPSLPLSRTSFRNRLPGSEAQVCTMKPERMPSHLGGCYDIWEDATTSGKMLWDLGGHYDVWEDDITSGRML